MPCHKLPISEAISSPRARHGVQHPGWFVQVAEGSSGIFVAVSPAHVASPFFMNFVVALNLSQDISRQARFGRIKVEGTSGTHV